MKENETYLEEVYYGDLLEQIADRELPIFDDSEDDLAR